MLAAFGCAHMDLRIGPATAPQIFHADIDRFGDPQAGMVDQSGAGPEAGFVQLGQDLANLLVAQDQRQGLIAHTA